MEPTKPAATPAANTHPAPLRAPGLGPQPGEEPRRREEIFTLPVDGKEKELSPVMPARMPLMASHAYANHMKLSGTLPNGCVSFAFPHVTADGARSNHVVLVNAVTGAAQSVEVYGLESLSGFQPKVRVAASVEAFFVSEVSEKTISLRWRIEGEQEWRARVKLPMAMPSVP